MKFSYFEESTVECRFPPYAKSAYKLQDVNDFNEVLELYDRVRVENPDHCVFMELDDIPQADYTGKHAEDAYGVYSVDHIPDDILAREHIQLLKEDGYPHVIEDFIVPEINFERESAKYTSHEIYTPQDINGIERLSKHPEKLLDKTFRLMILPFKKPYQLLWEYPNG